MTLFYSTDMNLIKMSLSGAALILTATIIRAVAINKLPKKTFLTLWWIALLRLLIPYSIPSVSSIYSLFRQNTPLNTIKTSGYITPAPVQESFFTLPDTLPPVPVEKAPPVSLWSAAWIAGAFICILFLTISYLRFRFEFQMSLPVENIFAGQWLKAHPLKRPISIRQSDRISAPLTYGFFKPVILMPKNTDWTNTKQLQYVLLHEYVHIRRFDAVTKMIAALALCIHWFNPFVWVMYILFNRDIELACDESVIFRSGETSKASYARMLISIEETKNGIMPFCSYFSKNAAEERITAIMKIKKPSVLAVFIAAALTISSAAVFATSAEDRQEELPELADSQFLDEDFEKLYALQFDNYENMKVSEFRDKVWKLTDTREYLDLLERFLNDKELDEMKDSGGIASFLFYILGPLTSENGTGTFGGYVSTNYPGVSDDALLEFFISLTVKNAEGLTVQEYNNARLAMTDGFQKIIQGKTDEQLQNKALMQESIRSETEALINQWSTDSLQIDVEYSYLPLVNPPTESNIPQNEPQEQEKRSPYGTEEDYRSLLTLKTEGYQNMSIADFNMLFLEWSNEHYDQLERITGDILWNDFAVPLEQDEMFFVTVSTNFSGVENGKYVQSSYTGRPEEDPSYNQYLPQKLEGEGGRSAWCDLYYQFSYHITDKKSLTVGERDRCVVDMINAVKEFWDSMDIEETLQLTEQDIVKKINEFATEYSNSNIIINAVSEDNVGFEKLDERHEPHI